MKLPKPSYANVTSTLALVLAASGTAYAASLPTNSVGTPQLKAGAVTGPKVAPAAIGTGKIAGSAVTGGKIADGSVAPQDLSPTVVSERDAAIAAQTPLAYSVSEGTIQFLTDEHEFADSNPKELGSLAVPPGRKYFVVAQVRAFTSGANSGITCSLDNSGISVVNSRVDGGVRDVTLAGVTSNFDGALELDCSRAPGATNVTVSFDISAVRVQ